MRNIITILFILFALFLHEKNYAQTIDFDDFYIESEDELSNARKTQIQKVLREFKIALLEDLEDRGKRIPNRTFYDEFIPAKLQGFDIQYNPEMDEFILGKARYDKDYDQLIVTTYLYDIINEGDKTRLSVITYDVNDEFINISRNEQNYRRLGAITNNKLFPDLPQRDMPAPSPQTKPQPAETIAKPSPKPTPKPKAPRAGKEKKTPPVRVKTCSKAPAAVVIGIGALMGGGAVYLRSRAINIYDEDYRPIIGSLDSDAELDRARRPNQTAHIVGAAGILTAGIGVWLWAKCTKQNKRANLGILHHNPHLQRLQFTPELQYNAATNQNIFQTKLTYQF